MKCRIAVAQIRVKQYTPASNLKKAEAYIKKATRAKADIIVFPEDFVAGSIETKRELADKDHTYRNYFQGLAQKYAINVVVGSIIEEENKKFYNTTYYIDSSGTVRGRYRKIHLWLSERGYYEPGKDICVFETKFGKIGLIICWDLAFPEIFRAMEKKGAQIVFCPSYWCYEDAGPGMRYDRKSEGKFIDALCVARAFENEMVIVQCNAAGRVLIDGEVETVVGHSQIAVPFQGAIKKFNHNREAMFIHTVDTGILKVSEKSYQIKSDLKRGMLV